VGVWSWPWWKCSDCAWDDVAYRVDDGYSGSACLQVESEILALTGCGSRSMEW